mmetsp:Transcript_9081/g.8115  ORF Transcript_9081/g.8115 Transcript_9081/m.8115 type:complete len:315 (-) Transcript_9081:264-1208(-)
MEILSNQGIIYVISILFTVFVIIEFIVALLTGSLTLFIDSAAIASDIALFAIHSAVESIKLSSGSNGLDGKEKLWLRLLLPSLSIACLLIVVIFIIFTANQQLYKSSHDVKVSYLLWFGSFQIIIDLISISLFVSRGNTAFLESQSNEMIHIDKAFALDLNLSDSHDNANDTDNDDEKDNNQLKINQEVRCTELIVMQFPIYLSNYHIQRSEDKLLSNANCKDSRRVNVDMMSIYARVNWDLLRSIGLLSTAVYCAITKNQCDAVTALVVASITLASVLTVIRDIVTIMTMARKEDRDYSAVSRDDDLDDGVIS